MVKIPTQVADASLNTLAQIRATEFARLDEQDIAYLDFTGSALYPRSLIEFHAAVLANSVFGNPHSASPTSVRATDEIMATRRAILAYFRADPDEYDLCLTANASAALKLVAEGFPFDHRSQLVLTADNHNSVNGIRQFALGRGATVRYLGLDAELRVPDDVLDQLPNTTGRSLFGFPAQSNFSGVKHSLSLVAAAQQKGFTVVMDAAAFVPTNPLDLSQCHPDFVCLSFYKMFGYPTGVGALIARRDALQLLRRPWFAGGTVAFASVEHKLHVPWATIEAFEDGTPDFLNVAAVRKGLEFLGEVGPARTAQHVSNMTSYLLDGLRAARHPNGRPRALVYGPHNNHRRGGTVAFNLLDATGRGIPFEIVETLAARRNVSLRGGCFCNPGASEAAFDLRDNAARECLDTFSSETFSPTAFQRCIGDRAVGALRVSVGIPTNTRDIDRLLEIVNGGPENYVQDGV